MRRSLFLIAAVFSTAIIVAQSPQKMSYQSVIRNATDDLVTESTVGIQISILQGTPAGTAVYVETHTPMTNINGLASLEIGEGTPVTGTFPAIDWGAGPYFIKTETDPAGGTNYILSGTSELLSVPYALYAASAGDDGDWNWSVDTVSTDKRVGIGTHSPDTTLHVDGGFKYVDGNQENAKILTSDPDGNASWQSLSPEAIFGSGNVPKGDLSCLGTVGSLGFGTSLQSVAVSGDYAYVVDVSSDDLKVIDISNPAVPALAGSLGIGSFPASVAVSGNYAYVVDQVSADLKVIDISNPASPALTGSLGIGPKPRYVAVSGNYAYVVDLLSLDLKVIDISDPAAPASTGSLGIGSFPQSLAVSGNYAYVVGYESEGLKVIDISNPAVPVLVGSLGIGSDPNSVAVSGNYAYVVDGYLDELEVIDISNPAAPALAGSLGIGPIPSSVAVSGNYAYVVDPGSEDLKVIDISDPAAPSLAGSLGIGTSPRSIAVSGNYAYVVDYDSEDLKVIELFCTEVTTFNPLTWEFSSTKSWQEDSDVLYTLDKKVGIGIASPSAALSVVGVVRATRNDTESEFIEIYHDGSNASINTEGDGRLDLGHDGTRDLSIMSNGRVGIGTISPDQKLHVVGDILATGNVYSEAIAFSAYSSSTTNDLSTFGTSAVIDFSEQSDPAFAFFSNTFTAPRTGMYFFTTSVSFSEGDGSDDTMWIGFDIDGSGSPTQEISINPRALSSAGVELSVSHSTVMLLNSGDEVTVLLRSISATSPVEMINRSFSGYYIGD